MNGYSKLKLFSLILLTISSVVGLGLIIYYALVANGVGYVVPGDLKASEPIGPNFAEWQNGRLRIAYNSLCFALGVGFTSLLIFFYAKMKLRGQGAASK